MALDRVRLHTHLVEDLLDSLRVLTALLGVHAQPFFELWVLDHPLRLLEHLDDDLLGVADVGQLVDEEVLRRLHRHLP
jgi:hypothetical protein